MNWYLIQTKVNAHFIASKNLRQQNFNVFLPLSVKTSKKRGKFFETLYPLFPGYLFLGTSNEPVQWKSVNATRGVAKAVSLDGKFRPVDEDIIKSLKYRCDETGILQNLNNIVCGDRAKIERGPFADFICRIDQVSDRQRIWVLIDILQQQTRTEISTDHLVKIS